MFKARFNALSPRWNPLTNERSFLHDSESSHGLEKPSVPDQSSVELPHDFPPDATPKQGYRVIPGLDVASNRHVRVRRPVRAFDRGWQRTTRLLGHARLDSNLRRLGQNDRLGLIPPRIRLFVFAIEFVDIAESRHQRRTRRQIDGFAVSLGGFGQVATRRFDGGDSGDRCASWAS